jgi:hypothetical protein
MKFGNCLNGRARLEALEKDARSRGFGLIARKASAAFITCQRPEAPEVALTRLIS